MRNPLLAALFVAVTGVIWAPGEAAAQAQPDPAKVAVIRQILEVTHAADQVVGAIEASVPAQRATGTH